MARNAEHSKPENLEEARFLGDRLLRVSMEKVNPEDFAMVMADPVGDEVFQTLGGKIGESLYQSGEDWTFENFKAHLKTVWADLLVA